MKEINQKTLNLLIWFRSFSSSSRRAEESENGLQLLTRGATAALNQRASALASALALALAFVVLVTISVNISEDFKLNIRTRTRIDPTRPDTAVVNRTVSGTTATSCTAYRAGRTCKLCTGATPGLLLIPQMLLPRSHPHPGEHNKNKHVNKTVWRETRRLSEVHKHVDWSK